LEIFKTNKQLINIIINNAILYGLLFQIYNYNLVSLLRFSIESKFTLSSNFTFSKVLIKNSEK